MQAFRRGAAAMLIAGMVTAVLKMLGNRGLPPQEGSWHELQGPDYR